MCHIISGDLWAGAEAQTYTLLRELKRRGSCELFVVLLNEGRLGDELRRLAIPVTVFPESRFSFPALVRMTRDLLRENRIEIVHAHRYKENVLAVLASLAVGVRRVQTVHGWHEKLTGPARWKMSGYRALNLLVSLLGRVEVVAVSEDLAKLLGRVFPKKRITVVRNGIDPSLLPPSSEEGGIVAAVGRLVPVKNFGGLLEAFAVARRLAPGAKLWLVGEGPEQIALGRKARALGLAECVTFFGHRDDAVELVARASVFVSSSDHEGIPVSLLEAMAMGKAVVATAVGGVPEVVNAPACGVLVEKGDMDALGAAIGALLKAHDRRERLGAAASSRIEEGFTVARQAGEMIRFYRRAAGIGV